LVLLVARHALDARLSIGIVGVLHVRPARPVAALTPFFSQFGCVSGSVRHVDEGLLDVLMAADTHLITDVGVVRLRGRREHSSPGDDQTKRNEKSLGNKLVANLSYASAAMSPS